MASDNISEEISDMRADWVSDLIEAHVPERAHKDQWNLTAIAREAEEVTGLKLPIEDWALAEGSSEEELEDKILLELDKLMAERAVKVGSETMRWLEKTVLLEHLDHHWREHLQNLNYLRQGIGLRAYGQRNPLDEYKRESFVLFEDMLVKLRRTVCQYLALVQFKPAPDVTEQASGEAQATGESDSPEKAAPEAAHSSSSSSASSPPKQGRNEPCYCGSGKKFKHCHGRI